MSKLRPFYILTIIEVIITIILNIYTVIKYKWESMEYQKINWYNKIKVNKLNKELKKNNKEWYFKNQSNGMLIKIECCKNDFYNTLNFKGCPF